jgi:hypothetical protein
VTLKLDFITTRIYEHSEPNIQWKGLKVEHDNFIELLNEKVKPRLNDDEGRDAFYSFLDGLDDIGFSAQNLSDLLDEDKSETRDWAICESISEAWLECNESVIWPWNSDRDLKTPLASLPGADLVGFEDNSGVTTLVLGEVKASTDKNSPPNVMVGKKGMIDQLEVLATDKRIRITLIKWLFVRCNKTVYEEKFVSAIQTMLASKDCLNVKLYGVLVRDTEHNKKDLENRAKALSKTLQSPQQCTLYCLYLPVDIKALPSLIEK